MTQRKKQSSRIDGNSSSSVESVSNLSESCSVKEYDFNREQYGALASKNLKELVGRKPERQSSHVDFGEIYKELLSESCLSLMTEADWRRLIKNKEINYSQLTDYYKRQVQDFYKDKGGQLIHQINKLVVSAYGKCISPDKKHYSDPYRKYIKIYGKQQFLDRKEWCDKESPSVERGRPQPRDSGRMTGTINQASQFRARQNSASADKNSALRFRRFGKNRAHYKRVIGLLLEYFAEVKEFAYKLDRHLDLFLQINPRNESGGWFQFKSMVYNDLMGILFSDSKVAAFLSHLHGFFDHNKFYASRFRSVQRKLATIGKHLTGFSGKGLSQVDSVEDAIQIVKAYKHFCERKNSRKNRRKKQLEIRKRNRLRYSNRHSRISLLEQRILVSRDAPQTPDFDYLKQGLLDCLYLHHKLLFCKKVRQRPLTAEIKAFKVLSEKELASMQTLPPLLAPWFTQPVECVDCQRIFCLKHILEELGVKLPEVEGQSDEFAHEDLGRPGMFSRNRESQAYSLTQAKIVQDDLKSPNHSHLRSGQSPLQPSSGQNVPTFKKRKKKKRRKKAKKASASLHKVADVGEPAKGAQAESTQLFAQLSKQSLGRNASNALGHEHNFKKRDSVDQNSKSFSIKEKKNLQSKTRDMLKGAMKGLEVWTETTKKLGNKHRKDERSRKRGQRRNKKMRMNEDLKAMKAYQEWKKALEARQVGERHFAEGVWVEARKSLLIQKRY